MLIGLSGYAQTGKDTTAEILVTKYGFSRLAFADLLRAAVYALNPHMAISTPTEPVTYAQVIDLYGYEQARKTDHKDEIRRLLQRMGTEVGRNLFGENFWVEQALKDVDPREDVVVTDCRFRNEATAITDRDGEVWRIERPGIGPANDHPSEVGLDNWAFDRYVSNDGDFDDLAVEVGHALERSRFRLGTDVSV